MRKQKVNGIQVCCQGQGPCDFLKKHAGSLVRFLPRRGVNIDRCRPATGHDAVKGVVVLHRHRVELVIVTSNTSETQPEHGLSQCIDRVLDRKVVVVLGIKSESS